MQAPAAGTPRRVAPRWLTVVVALCVVGWVVFCATGIPLLLAPSLHLEPWGDNFLSLMLTTTFAGSGILYPGMKWTNAWAIRRFNLVEPHPVADRSIWPEGSDQRGIELALKKVRTISVRSFDGRVRRLIAVHDLAFGAGVVGGVASVGLALQHFNAWTGGLYDHVGRAGICLFLGAILLDRTGVQPQLALTTIAKLRHLIDTGQVSLPQRSEATVDRQARLIKRHRRFWIFLIAFAGLLIVDAATGATVMLRFGRYGPLYAIGAICVALVVEHLAIRRRVHWRLLSMDLDDIGETVDTVTGRVAGF